MTALHLQLHPEPIGDTTEADRNAQSEGRADLHHQNTKYLDTPTPARPTAHCNTEVARPFVPENDTHSPPSAPSFAPARPVALTPIADRLWARLYGTWGSPRRASTMTGRAKPKYLDIKNYSFGHAHLSAHLAGHATYAATLGAAGDAWAGCKDYDNAGEAEIIAALATAAAKGIIAAAFLMPGAPGEHTGGHIWTCYDRAYPVADICAQLRTIPRTRKGEDYPSGNPVRLPFGYHKVKKTRGTLVLQDGRRFNLDTPEGLAAGIEAFLALPLNGKPKPVPAGDTRASGAAWGEAYKAEDWQNLPAGGPLWRSPWLVRCATTRPDLAKLLRSERVTLSRDGAPDDSDSAQVAALAFNLSSADIDRQQARAIADHLYATLRPGRTREHYRAHFDAEWERYKPTYYTGRLIRILGSEESETPQPLAPAEHKPPRASRARKDRPQKVAGPLGYLEWLRAQAADGVVMLSQRECAAALGCCVRTIKRYEKALGELIERDPLIGRQHGRLFLRGDNITPAVIDLAADDVVIGEAATAQQDATNAAPASMQEEHPRPLVTAPDPAPATLAAGVRRAIRAIEQDALDEETGEIRRLARATPDLVRAWLSARWPDLDTTDVEEIYPTVRKELQERRQRQKQRDYWQAERQRVRALEDEPLLVALGGWASKLARAEGKQPGSGYAKKCAAHFAIHDDERRRRGLSQVETPDRASRKAATDRTVKLAQALSRPPERPETPSQTAFVNLVEDAAWLPALSAQAGQGQAPRGCSSPPAAAPIDPSGIIGRLYDLRAARTGG